MAVLLVQEIFFDHNQELHAAMLPGNVHRYIKLLIEIRDILVTYPDE
jgi:hypothetical protein